jgi:hypothetical protein
MKKNIEFLNIMAENNKDVFENLHQQVKIKLLYVYNKYSNLISNEEEN